MDDRHRPHHLAESGPRRLLIALVIVVTIMVVEVVGGLVSNSLALIGDAGHMLVDALALAISFVAIKIAQRPATTSRTFGYHRVEVMAALTNGIILLLIAAYILFEAYQRFRDPPEVETTLMLAVAGLGLAANLTAMALLRRVRHSSINVRAAFWHILGDTIASVGVIVGGIIIAVTGWGIVDPIIAVVISCIIIWGAFRLVKESSDILLEAAPGHLEVAEVNRAILAVPGVRDVHDMHVWTITSGIHALSAHLLIEDQTVARSAEIARAVEQSLSERFSISHTTLQLECERCEGCPAGLMCDISRPAEHA
ncbi:MAG: cation diffusion facilitator family transporter [Dehalococcoidales bacterium]